jgi:hypothetical protein
MNGLCSSQPYYNKKNKRIIVVKLLQGRIMVREQGTKYLLVHTFYKNKRSICSKGIKQRLIIKLLASQSYPSKSDVTRGVIAKYLSDKLGISKVNAYNYVFKELDRCLLPKALVEECGAIVTGKGPGLLQKTGIPCYCLTPLGMLVASTLEDEFDLWKRMELAEHYLRSQNVLSTSHFSSTEELMLRLQRYPQPTLELIMYSVMEFINGKTRNPLDSVKRQWQ